MRYSLAKRAADARAEMEAFDRLPQPIRLVLIDGAVPVYAERLTEILRDLKRRLPEGADLADLLRQALPGMEEENIRKFAAYYRTRYGTPYPHTEAGVAPLRMNSGGSHG